MCYTSYAMNFETLLYEEAGPVATLTINRPKARNALNPTVLAELQRALEALRDSAVRAVILTGIGDRAFVAGADIAAMAHMEPAAALHFAEQGHRLGQALESLPQPVIAAVNGFALGGGLELALACDLIYAARNASFGAPEVAIGVMPGFGATQRLARRVGIGHAARLIYTGDPVDAEQALALGLCEAVVSPDELLPLAQATAQKIASRAPRAVASAKRAVLWSAAGPLAEGNRVEARLFAELFATADQKEGMKAFLEKRPPVFQGR